MLLLTSLHMGVPPVDESWRISYLLTVGKHQPSKAGAQGRAVLRKHLLTNYSSPISRLIRNDQTKKKRRWVRDMKGRIRILSSGECPFYFLPSGSSLKENVTHQKSQNPNHSFPRDRPQGRLRVWPRLKVVPSFTPLRQTSV